MYEPEQFPGLMYRMKDPMVVMLLLASGKLVCTGDRKKSEKPPRSSRGNSRQANSYVMSEVS
jgi:TATA-box binding protein (TBP) (component of TFIID and TFIIIB)